jgi:hypothetical protein
LGGVVVCGDCMVDGLVRYLELILFSWRLD